MAETKMGADLKISKRFKYTPIFKNSFIRAKEETPNRCACCQTRTAKLTGYTLLILLFILSFTGSILLWATNTYRVAVEENLTLRKNTHNVEMWLKSPVKPKLKLYFFNYTNVEGFLKRGEKLKVQEVGPYTYWETAEKVNIVWNNNGTVTYQERRSFKFAPEYSNGRETDVVQVMNLPLLVAVSTVRNEFYIVRLSLAAILSSMNAKVFVKVTVRDLLWGYDDPIYTMGRTVMNLKQHIPFKRFGLLTPKNGTSQWRMTMNTGELDIEQLGLMTHYNGEDRVDFWNSDECNRIDGSDGSRFPPHLLQQRTTLHVYNRDMCRRFPLVFKEHSTALGDIPTLRYHQPRDVFAHASENPDNACFCDPKTRVCPPSGVFNMSPCIYGSPIFLSFPHFYLGDPALLETVDGLKPDPEKHDTSVDIHPEIAVPITGVTRFQTNIMVQKAVGINILDAFEDNAILPILWCEVVLDDLPPEIRSLLYQITFGARALLLMMLYGLPVLALVCACALLKAFRRFRRRYRTALPPVAPATAAVVALTPADILEVP